MNRSVRQLVIGLLALPLSLLPFWAYLTYTPEGRLVRDRALVAVNPPTLPHVSASDIRRGVVPRYTGAVMVLAYHGIGRLSDGEGGFVTPPKRFGEQLVAMRHAGMHAVTAAQVADAFAGGKPLPSRAVMISFDDGRSDAVMYADPLLKQAGMKATMFVITSAASGHGVYYADWGRLEAAAKSGRWDLQSHTDAMHDMQRVEGRELPLLTSLRDGESVAGYRQRIHRDLARADRVLTDHAGKKPVALAYPFGAYGADRTNDPHVRAALHDEVAHRYAVAFQQDDQDTVALATPYDERTELRRLEVADWSAKELMQKVAAAAGRTETTMTSRQDELQRQADTGAELPAGIVAAPGAPSRQAMRSTAPARTPARGSSAPTATASPPPTSVAAAPAFSDAQPTQPPPTQPKPQSPPTTQPPRPPSSPPTTSPPTTDAPGRSGDAPGHSSDPPGNGGGKK